MLLTVSDLNAPPSESLSILTREIISMSTLRKVEVITSLLTGDKTAEKIIKQAAGLMEDKDVMIRFHPRVLLDGGIVRTP